MEETQFPETVIDMHQFKLVNESGHKQVQRAYERDLIKKISYLSQAYNQLLNLKADHHMYRKDTTALSLDNN